MQQQAYWRTRYSPTVYSRYVDMVVDGPRTVSHDPVGIVTGSKGLLLDVGLDHSLLLVIDRFDGNGDVISA